MEGIIIFIVLIVILGVIGLLVVVAVLFAKTRRLTGEKESSERRIKALLEYGRKTGKIAPVFVDVVLFGPRGSGKTSIAMLWTSPWTRISEIEASTSWRTFETNIHEYERQKRYDDDFGFERTYVRVLRLRVQDYPGEDSYRLQAIKDLEDKTKKMADPAEKAIVIFIFKVGCHNGRLEDTEDNAEYFSRVFVEEVNEHLQNISKSVAKAVIVFNKADLLPSDWDEADASRALKQANAGAVHQVERLFSGITEYHVTSAKTGQGLIGLLGSIGIEALDSKIEKERFIAGIHRLREEFEVHQV
jgi:hypothetical protein